MPADATPRRARAQRRDAIENREKILRTAAELIARRGHTVPLTEIAEAAGVGVGTFYRGFPDRTALLDELQRRGYELLLDTLDRITAAGLRGADALEAYLRECLVLADQLVAMPLRGSEPLTDDAAVAAKGRIGRAVGEMVGQGHADVIVCGTLVGVPLPLDPDWSTTARRHVDLFVRGIRTR